MRILTQIGSLLHPGRIYPLHKQVGMATAKGAS